MPPAQANNPDETADAAAPSPKVKIPRGGPDAADKARLRNQLLGMRTQLARSSSDLADEALKGSGQDFKVDHMADYGSDNFEQDMSLSLLEGEAELLEAIETAIRKIDGSEEPAYGLCEACVRQGGGWDAETGAPWIPRGPARRSAVRAALRPAPGRAGRRVVPLTEPAPSQGSAAQDAGPGLGGPNLRILKVACLILLAVMLVADLWSKSYMQDLLGLVAGQPNSAREIDVIPGFLAWQGTWNPGVTFGLAPGQTSLILALTSIATIGLFIWFLGTKHRSKCLHVGLALILSGALGNLWDRWQWGQVRDFILIYVGELKDPDIVSIFGFKILPWPPTSTSRTRASSWA